MRLSRCAVACAMLPGLYAAVPKPADWVPVRWPWTDVQSLELLQGTPVNCLLLKSYSPEFAAAAEARGIVTLAVLSPGGDVGTAARQAVAAKVSGVVLDGDFPDGAATGLTGFPVVQLTARNRMPLGSNAPILGTYQGVWPGISLQDDGGHKAGPTGSTWIDTNTGFIRAVRAWGNAALWIANQPPSGVVITGTRYMQAIADAAMSGARWVVAFDPEFTARLAKREATAMRDWNGMTGLMAYFEKHPEWRQLPEWGKFAIVQDPAKGGLLSGGILDMIAVKHTPVRAIPRQRLSPDALKGTTMAVNVDADDLTPEQKDVLRGFTRGGGMLLTGPAGWKDATPAGERITLDDKELKRLNDIWRDVNSMIGRRNLGVRLFNVSSMLSNLMASDDGKTAVLHLVNYADYPVESVTVHFTGKYARAKLLMPGGAEKPLEIYQTDEGGGVDIDKVAVCATITLEQ